MTTKDFNNKLISMEDRLERFALSLTSNREEAKDLLLAPSASISETAYKLGFEYPQYFSRLFKKKTGVSPSEYQSMN